MKSPCIWLSILLLALGAPLARAHAFLDHAEPKVGSKVASSPATIQVWFSQKLVVAFSDLQVFDAAGKEVDKRDQKLGGSDPALLSVSVPPLKPGKYKVIWRAASVDTHVTHGDFTFEVGP